MIKRVVSGLRKAALATIIGSVSLSGVNYYSMVLANNLAPSHQRIIFQKEFGTKIVGPESEIDLRDYSVAADVLSEAAESGDFTLPVIYKEPKDLLEKHPLDFFSEIITTGNSGYYLPPTNTLSVKDLGNRDTLHHEIGHLKAFKIAEENPEFLDEWNSLSVDDDGNSMYRNQGAVACGRIRGLTHLVKQKFEGQDELLGKGFVSNYARTNVHEDIAEVTEVGNRSAGIKTYPLRTFLLSPEENPRLIGKFKLAEENGLIPDGYIDMVQLGELETKAQVCWHIGCSYSNRKDVETYLDESEKFLEKHPKGSLATLVRATRGAMLSNTSKSWGKDGYVTDPKREAQAEEELLAALTSGSKAMGYSIAIESLKELYVMREDMPKVRVMSEARDLYWKRFREGDLSVRRVGVNDFLTENGILTE